MRQFLTLLIVILSVFCCGSKNLWAQVAGPIKIPINPPSDTTKVDLHRSLFMDEMPECLYDPTSKVVLVNSYSGYGFMDVLVLNHTTMEVVSDMVETNTTSSIPISGSAGYYTLTIFTETGKEYWGWFVVEY